MEGDRGWFDAAAVECVEILPVLDDEAGPDGDFAARVRACAAERLRVGPGDRLLDADPFLHEGSDLPLADMSFDAVCAQRPFDCLPDVEHLVAEMVRVLRPGGRVVLLLTDWSSLSLASDGMEVACRFAGFKADLMRRGRYDVAHVVRAMASAGLGGIDVEPVAFRTMDLQTAWSTLELDVAEDAAIAYGALSAQDVACLRDGLLALDACGRFRASVDLLVVSAEKISTMPADAAGSSYRWMFRP